MIFLLREKIIYVFIPLYLWSQYGERWQLSVWWKADDSNLSVHLTERLSQVSYTWGASQCPRLHSDCGRGEAGMIYRFNFVIILPLSAWYFTSNPQMTSPWSSTFPFSFSCFGTPIFPNSSCDHLPSLVHISWYFILSSLHQVARALDVLYELLRSSPPREQVQAVLLEWGVEHLYCLLLTPSFGDKVRERVFRVRTTDWTSS